MYRDQLGKPAIEPDDIDAQGELEEVDLVDREERTEGTLRSSSDEAKRLERRERLRRRAQLLVTGKQDDEREFLTCWIASERLLAEKDVGAQS